MCSWVTKTKLEQNGFKKLLKHVDDKIAALATQLVRPLTQKFVESHLNDVGLAPEFATHTRMGALSGGQKVKVVLAASMWNTPHIVILDEPTNYLDRDSLGAMAEAIDTYDGGVVIISHNAQFVDQVRFLPSLYATSLDTFAQSAGLSRGVAFGEPHSQPQGLL